MADSTASKKESLDHPKVDVRAEPDWDKDSDPDWHYIDKVQENIQREVKQALQDAEDEGSGVQIGAAHDAVDVASRHVDPSKVDKIHVEIDDDDGRHIEIERPASGKNR
ncbi:MAG: hypothetical protein V1738_05240 [Patescibacteria group bacterium]